MKRERINLKELRTKVWWWHRQEIRRDGVFGVVWNKLTKEAAHKYELMRRSRRGKKFKKSYLELNSNERSFVHKLWCAWEKQPVRYAEQKNEFTEKGWTTILPNPPTQWNLHLPDYVLVAEFKRQIAKEREFQGMPSKNPRKGKKRRAASWNYIEILDRRNAGLPGFTAGERHMLNGGKQMASRFLRQFNKALAKALESFREEHDVMPLTTNEPADISPPEHSDESSDLVQMFEFFGFAIVEHPDDDDATANETKSE